MNSLFYVPAAVAVISTILVITSLNTVNALLYAIISLLSIALIFFGLGAPFIAALEVIIYAGAIMVLFVFVIMMLNVGPQAIAEERQWLKIKVWRGPVLLALILIGELAYVISGPATGASSLTINDPKQVGMALYGPYVLGVELASLVLLAGAIGAYHLGRRDQPGESDRGKS